MAKTETVPVLLRLAPDLLARIDAARGEVPRSIWIRNRLDRLVPEYTRYPGTGVTMDGQFVTTQPKKMASPLPARGGKLALPERMTMDDVRPRRLANFKPDKGVKK